jgi:hypothetical protein
MSSLYYNLVGDAFTFCPLLNESNCAAMDAITEGLSVPIVVYNPLAWERVEWVRLPVAVPSVQG